MDWLKTIILFLFSLIFFVPSATAVYNPSPPEKKTPSYLPNQIIVKFKPSQTPEELRQKAILREQEKKSGISGFLKYQLETIKLRIKNQKPPEERLQSLKDTETTLGVNQYRSFIPLKKSPPKYKNRKNTLGVSADPLSTYRLVKTNGQKPVETVLKKYRNLPEVESAFYDTIFTIQETPNDPMFSQMWALKKIEMENAWDITKGSTQVTVAVIDTGADYNHQDLKDNLLPGYNSLTGQPSAQDDHGHGTHVSGTIGALTNNNLGVAGINWQVRILPIKALTASGAGPLSAIANGIRYASNQAEDKKVKVINMSLGGPRYEQGVDTCAQLFNQVIQSANEANITVVVAAGNDNREATHYAPASCNGVITVGATTQSDGKASFSNYGSPLTLSAPGVSILSTFRGGGYRTLSGTSMAAPHVSGVVALMYAVNDHITPTAIKTIFLNPLNVDPINSSQLMGSGRLNGQKAVAAARDLPSDITSTPPSTSPTPTLPSGEQTPTPTTPPEESTPTPTPGRENSPTPESGQPTNTPSPSNSCQCQTNNSCSSSCSFDSYPDINYNDPISCQREKGVKGETPDQNNKNSYCQRPLRTKGDADGDNQVTYADYLYYVRAVSGGTIPKTINPDFNGDGKISPSDRMIIIRTLTGSHSPTPGTPTNTPVPPFN